MTDLTGISLASLIERDGVTLRGQAERYGACPKCDGHDRFHLRSYNGREYFFCRKCHDKRGDAVEYLRWQHGDTQAALTLASLSDLHECQAAYYIAARLTKEGRDFEANDLRESFKAQFGGQSAGKPKTRPARLARPTPTPKTARGVAIPAQLEEPPAEAWQLAMREFVAECAANIPGPVRTYLHGRGLTDDTIARYSLGYNATSQRIGGEWWAWRGVVIPTTYGGHVWRVNVRRRADDVTKAKAHNAEVKRTGEGKSWDDGKYIMATGSRAQLFNGDALAGPMHTVIVCAGEFDAMLAQQHTPAGVACITFGSESKRPTWETDYLLRDKRVLIAYDTDAAGDQGAAQWSAFGQRVCVPSGKDVTEFAQAGGDMSEWIQSQLDHDFEQMTMEMLSRHGYECSYNADGQIIVQREAVTA